MRIKAKISLDKHDTFFFPLPPLVCNNSVLLSKFTLHYSETVGTISFFIINLTRFSAVARTSVLLDGLNGRLPGASVTRFPY